MLAYLLPSVYMIVGLNGQKDRKRLILMKTDML